MPKAAQSDSLLEASFAPNSSYSLTLADAARIMREAMRDKSYEATIIGEEVARYLRWMRNADYSERSYYEYESILYRFVLDHADLGPMDFEPPVGVERIEEWVDNHWGHQAAGTRRKVLSILGAFFKWAYQRQRIGADPMPMVQRPKQRATTRRSHSPHKVHDIVKAQPLLRDQCAVMLLGMVGLRKNELRLLQIKHVDLDEGAIRLNQKGGDVLWHPIVYPKVIQRLAEHFMLDGRQSDEFLLHPRWERTLEDGTKVFQREDRARKMSVRGVHEWWVRVLERAELEHFPMHEMRHTAGTEFYKATKDMELTRKFMRHNSIITTSSTYVHLDREDYDLGGLKAAARWDESE